VDVLHDWLDILIAVTVLGGVVLAIGRYYNKRLERKIIDTLIASTKQIKTDANGGQSLNDVNVHVNELHDKFDAYVDVQQARDHRHDMQHQEIKYELATIKRLASSTTEGEQ
jgi:hypothetical protein